MKAIALAPFGRVLAVLALLLTVIATLGSSVPTPADAHLETSASVWPDDGGQQSDACDAISDDGGDEHHCAMHSATTCVDLLDNATDQSLEREDAFPSSGSRTFGCDVEHPPRIT